MSIYDILASKPHNPHYLNRYIRFIENCKQVNESYTGYTEKHHICPRSLFPEYKSFTKNPWNKVLLTARQHFIAHWILWKAYPGNKSMMFAFWNFRCTRDMKPSSRAYAKLIGDHREEISSIASTNNRKRVENGTHQFLGGEIQRKRVEDGTHNFLSGEVQREINKKRVEDGTHNFLDREAARERQLKRIKNGTHHFLGSAVNKKRVENGTHHFVGGEIQRKAQRKKVEDGTHHCIGIVACYNKQGKFIRVPKEVYHSQEGLKENWEYVTARSKEGKRRRASYHL